MPFMNDLIAVGSSINASLLNALVDGPQRFGDLATTFDTDETTLGQHLRELDAAGLISRRVETGPPLRVLYELTTEGGQLAPAIGAIAAWAKPRAMRPTLRNL